MKINPYLVFFLSIFTLSFGQNVQWANVYGSSVNDFSYFSIANDGNGNVYNAGSFSGSSTFGAFKLTSTGGVDNYIQKVRPDGSTEWCNKIGGTLSEGVYNSIAVDNNNNIYVTGNFSGTCTFSGTGNSSFSLSSTGGYDAYLVKYNPQGIILGAKRIISGSGEEKPFKMIVDHDNNIYITGSYGGNSGAAATFGTLTRNNTGVYDMFLLKLDPSLNQLWVNTAGSAADDLGSYLAIDSSNNVYVVTQYWTTLSFSNSATVLSHAAGANWDAALVKYNSNGTFVWAQKFGSTGHETCNGIAISKSGKIYWVGGISGVTTFSSANGSSLSLTSNGGYDALIIQYDLNGVVLKAKSFGSSGGDYFRSIVFSKNEDSLIVAGTYQNTVNFTSNSLSSINGTSDIVMLILDSACNALSSYSYGGTGSEEATEVLSDNKNNIYLEGTFSNSIRIENKQISSYGGVDIFLVKLFSRDKISDTCLNCNIFQFNGLVSCYPFSGNANDQTNNLFHGSLNGATPAPNRFNKSNEAYSFDGNDDIDFSNNAFKLGTYTYSAWVYLDTIPTATNPMFTILNVGGDTSSQTLSLNYVNSSLSSWNLSGAGLLSNISLTYSHNPTIRQWYFITITRDSAKTSMYINQDTAIIQRTTLTNLAKYNSSNYKCTVGSNRTTSNTYFKGRIDDVRIYNFALTMNDVSKLYSASNGYSLVEAGENRTLCLGGSVSLNASGAIEYSWTPSTGLNSTNIANPIATPSVTTTYYVSGSNGNCGSIDSITVFVPPVFTITSSGPDSICAGDTIILTASGMRKQYLWSTGATTQSIKVVPTQNTTYGVSGKISGCKDSTTRTIFMKSISVDAGANQTKCYGLPIQLQASGAISYSWSPSNGLSSTTISNPIANPTVTTTYHVTGVNGGCVSKDSIKITVNPTFGIAGNLIDSICIGDSIMISAVGGRDTYSWSNGGKSQSIKVAPASNSQFTVISGLNGCTDTAVKSIVVINNLPKAGNDVYLCGKKSVQLNATGSASYTWFPSLGLSDSTIGNPIAKPSITTTYILRGKTLNCIRYDTITIFVNPPLAISSPKDTICYGDSVLLQSSLADSYVWDNGATSRSIYVKPLTNKTYMLIATLKGCSDTAFKTIRVNHIIVDAGANQTKCMNTIVQLLATGANTYVWSPNTGLSSTTIANPVATPLTTTTYYVTGQVDGCSNTDSITVFVNPPFSLLATNDTICRSDSVKIFASTGRTSYLWNTGAVTSNISVAPQTTTTYKVISTLNSCTDTLLKTIFVKTCLGLDYLKGKASIRIYPNPTNGEINIQLPESNEKCLVSLFSADGKLIFQQYSDKSFIKFNTKVSSGVYFLNIESEKINYTEKIIFN